MHQTFEALSGPVVELGNSTRQPLNALDDVLRVVSLIAPARTPKCESDFLGTIHGLLPSSSPRGSHAGEQLPFAQKRRAVATTPVSNSDAEKATRNTHAFRDDP
jgi:hypothetical protein